MSCETPKKHCFVISPIGAPDSDVRHHADDVFEFIIKPAVESFTEETGIPFETLRADHQEETGNISEQMFEKILQADLCITVLTGYNANVFYELAVAQAAARPVIILMEDGQKMPFDIQDMRCVMYKLQPVNDLVKGKYSQMVYNMMINLHDTGWSVISLMHKYGYAKHSNYELQMREIISKTKPDTLSVSTQAFTSNHLNKDQQILLATGDIMDINEFNPSVVVSLESEHLQIARYYDRSISGILRYMDAQRSEDNRITKDSLKLSLQKIIKDNDISLPTSKATVIATPTDQLAKCGVKYVFHVATLDGAPGQGYHITPHLIDDCVRNCFDRFAQLSKEDSSLDSILLPLIGSGSSSLTPNEVAMQILKPAIRKMKAIPNCKKLYLLAWIEPHRFAILQAAKELDLIEGKEEVTEESIDT